MTNLIKVALISSLVVSCGPPDQDTGQVLDPDSQQIVSMDQALSRCGHGKVELVRIKGRVFRFGIDILQVPPQSIPFQTPVEGARVWIAEHPFTRWLKRTSDKNGDWSFYFLKRKGTTLSFSFVYEKDFYPAQVEQAVFPGGLPAGWDRIKMKSNTFSIGDDDVTDVSIQMPDELYLHAARSQLEAAISSLIGMPYPIQNIVVGTVGKSWASMFNPLVPHGDPGATVTVTPSLASPLQGPIYFNEQVQPDPTYSTTSVDGGVLLNNLPAGKYAVTAVKAPYSYDTVIFNVEAGINLYVASPPHSIQGTNSSPPGP